MIRLKNIANVCLGICYEIFFALLLVCAAFLICFIVFLSYPKP